MNTVQHLPQLKGDNYAAWKFRVRALLEEKQVLDVITKAINADPNLIKSNSILSRSL